MENNEILKRKNLKIVVTIQKIAKVLQFLLYNTYRMKQKRRNYYMLKNVITVASQDLEEFEQYLYERENARATIR